MVNNKHNQASMGVTKNDGMNIISVGAVFIGSVEIHSQLHIDGNLQGDVLSKSTVYIGKSGNYVGKIVSKHVIVSGAVSGMIHADTIEILKPALVKADLVADNIKIEQGAIFVGRIVQNTNES